MQQSQDVLVTHDGLRLFTQSWRPASDVPASAILLVSHGYAEHSARYAPLGRHLAERGCAVCALDHRGHGKSEGMRANVGVFRSYVDDLRRFAEARREAQPGLPRFVLGHSMGALVAAQFALEHPTLADGLILSAPFVQNATPVSPLLLALSGTVSRFLPGLPVVKLDTSKLSRDPAVVSAYQNDPLVYNGLVKARMGFELKEAGAYLLSRAEGIRSPTLILHGSADTVADPAGSRALFERIAAPDKTLKRYDGAYHEILNDYGKEQVLADIAEWLGQRVGEDKS